jgi:hypothetical protein
MCYTGLSPGLDFDLGLDPGSFHSLILPPFHYFLLLELKDSIKMTQNEQTAEFSKSTLRIYSQTETVSVPSTLFSNRGSMAGRVSRRQPT